MSASEPSGSFVQEYAEAAAAHGQATAAGDSARANQAHEVIAAIYGHLRDRGEQRELLALLDATDPAVVAWAAAHALEFAPEDGERALTDLAPRNSGIIGFGAAMTLSTWREGKLRFP